MQTNRKALERKIAVCSRRMKLSVNPSREFSLLIGQFPTSQFISVAHEIKKDESLHAPVFGILFPRNYCDIFNIVDGVSPLADAYVFDWISAELRVHAKEINEFIEKEEAIYQLLFAGKASEALIALDNLEESHGLSLWSIETRFSLLEISEGVESHKIYYEKIVNECKTNNSGFLECFVNYFSYKAEKNVTVERYQVSLSKSFPASGKDAVNSINQLLSFALCFYGTTRFDDIGDLLTYVRTSSLIDRYLWVVRCIQLSLIDEKLKKFQKNLIEILIKISGPVKDSRLNNLLIACNSANFDVTEKIHASQVEYLKIFDAYTKGDYLTSATADISIYPMLSERISITEIKARARTRISKDDDQFDEIFNYKKLEYLYSKVLFKGDDSEIAAASLLKYTYMFQHAPWSAEIFSFLMRELKHSLDPDLSRYSLIGDLCGSSFNPRLLVNFKFNINNNSFYKQYTKNISYQLLDIAQHGNDAAIERIAALIPEHRVSKHRAQVAMRQGLIQSAISPLKELLTSIHVLDQQDAIELLAQCIIKWNEPIDSVAAITKQIAARNAYRARVPVAAFLTALERIRDTGNSSSDVYLSIAVLKDLEYKEGKKVSDTSRSIGCDDLLDDCGVARPSELKNKSDSLDKQLLIYFLKNIAIPSVLDSHITYKMPLDIENERVKICQWLVELDDTSKGIYIDEIAKITQQQYLRKNINSVEQSKIHVDIEGVKNAVYSEGKDLYIRFQSLPQTRNDQMLLLISSMTEIRGKKIQLIMPPNERSSALLQFFMFVRDRFVSSNEFGLDVYLSVGVRHSTLEKQLRSVFEIHKLITQRNNEGEYSENIHWKPLHNTLEMAKQLKFQDALALCSKKIDATIEKLKNKWIQIRTEQKDTDGVFDFRFTTKELFHLHEILPTTSLEDATVIIINTLWKRTDICLDILREKISKDLVKELTDELDQLSRALIDIGDPLDPRLSGAIAMARTEIQTEINRTAEWFKRSARPIPGDYYLNDSIEVALTMVNRCYPNRLIELERKNSSNNLKMRGESFVNLVNIFHIALDNIQEHCELTQISKIPVKIDYRTSSDTLYFKLTNPHSIPHEKLHSKKERINTLLNQAKASNLTEQVKSEGGSGFLKIAKTVKIDLKGEVDISANINKDHYDFSLTMREARIFR